MNCITSVTSSAASTVKLIVGSVTSCPLQASVAHWSREKGIKKARRTRRQEQSRRGDEAKQRGWISEWRLNLPKSVSPEPVLTPNLLIRPLKRAVQGEENWSAKCSSLKWQNALRWHTHIHIRTHTHTMMCGQLQWISDHLSRVQHKSKTR